MLIVRFNRVRSLSIVLQDVEVVLPERELTSQQKADLHGIADGCRNVLDELEKLLDKYRELESCPESVGKRVKKVWKRLKWEPEDIQELRNRISSNITLLNAFNGRLTRDSVVKLVRH
jgi:peptidoglycan hydrolase CwlO-like protein